MAACKFSNPFAPLDLSREARAQLAELADLFVHKALVNYEQYLFKDERQLAPGEWKFLKQHENIRVFRQRSAREVEKAQSRRASNGSLALSSQRSASSQEPAPSASEEEDDSYDLLEAPKPKPADLPVMLSVGTLQGDLMDTMYGVVNPSLDMMRIQTSYVDSVDIVNAATLDTLKEPTPEHPFDAMRIRWVIKGQPLHIRSIVKNRDMVYLESTGLTRLPTTNEVVGFHLLHSVNFPQTHALEDSLRGNVSICALYRQYQDNVVDVYVRGFLDPTGRILRALVVKSATVVMLAVGRNIMCAQMKKLAYALRRRHNPTLQNTTFGDRLRLRHERKRASTVSTSSGHDHRVCAICTKGLSSLAPLLFGRKSRAGQCRLCLETVCSSCRVKKRLSSITPEDGHLNQQSVTFCLLCVTAVAQANALDIARDEVIQQDATLGYGRSSSLCASPTVMGESFFEDDDIDSQRSAQPVHSASDDALW